MKRAITGFHRDAQGDWVAQLACGHGQHVRHRPPWQIREWVLCAASRQRRVGEVLECLKCDRGEPADPWSD